ncbi:MAG: CpaF family protein [Bryobacteraceae bacterium]
MSWEVITPFLQPLEELIRNPEISEILVNGPSRVFVESDGELREMPGLSVTEKCLQIAVRNIARVLGDDVNPERPLLDARLPDGSRVAAVLPPCAVNGTALAIRKFDGRRYTPQDLVRLGTLSEDGLSVLQRAVEARQNILISGGAGTGKTTLLNALASFIAANERVVVIEDTSELELKSANLVRLEARREQPGVPAVTIRDLVKATLRLRPDRILLGEIRSGEAYDLLVALNTGHEGSLSTLHANTAAKVLTRFTTCVLQAGVELPYKAVRSNIAEAVHLLVHIERRRGKRLVSEMLAVKSYDPELDRYELEPVYQARPWSPMTSQPTCETVSRRTIGLRSF